MVTLKEQMLSDLEDVFYNVNECAESITYTPRGGSPQAIKAVILSEDAPLVDPDILGDTLRIRVKVSDVAQPGRDSLTLYGETWFVVRNAGGGPAIGEWELEISRSEQRVV